MTTEVFDILSPILGDELAQAVIEHRKAKRAKLTAYAAKLQVKEYIKTGEPIAAAEMQILHGWQAIRADWYFNQIAKDKKSAEQARPAAFKTSADRYQSREEFIRASIAKNRAEEGRPVNPDMLARLNQVGVVG